MSTVRVSYRIRGRKSPFRAIPVPGSTYATGIGSILAIKEVVETLIGVRGTDAGAEIATKADVAELRAYVDSLHAASTPSTAGTEGGTGD